MKFFKYCLIFLYMSIIGLCAYWTIKNCPVCLTIYCPVSKTYCPICNTYIQANNIYLVLLSCMTVAYNNIMQHNTMQ